MKLISNIIFRLAEIGAIGIVGFLFGATIVFFSSETAISIAYTAISAILALFFLIGVPTLMVFFFFARLREWKAERDYQHNNADRQILREQVYEFVLFTYGDENNPHREIDRE